MIQFFIGLLIGSFVLESIVINVVYMSSPALFNDIILTEKSEKKLRSYYEKNR